MVLYTIFAWTAVVVAGAAYYWLYIRKTPLSTSLLGLSGPHSRELSAQGIGSPTAQKRKRKTAPPKRRVASLQTSGLFSGASGVSGDESDDEAARIKSQQQLQDERRGIAETKALRIDTEPPRKLAKRETHFTSSEADESDAIDTPTPAPSKKQPAGASLDSTSSLPKSAAEERLERTVAKTAVDDMIPEEDRPKVARVMRITSPSEEPSKKSITVSHVESPSPGPAVDKDGLTKRQRQNQKKKERHREARAREEAARLERLKAHQKELETIRLNSQIKAAEKKVGQTSVWGQQPQQTSQPAMEDSVYTVRNLSDENLTTVGHRSDGQASEEGWQEVTSKAAKRAAAQKTGDKAQSTTEGSEEISSVGDSEEGSLPKAQPAYTSSNSFANLES